jgi:hypothetical protein
MALKWQDGDFTVASAVSPKKPSSGTPDGKYNLLSQDFMQFFANFAALDIGTTHPTVADYYLVEETAPQKVGGGVARWTRVYAKVPESHTETESYGFQRIGFVGSAGINVTVVSGRQREVIDVQSDLVHDYFLVGSPTYPTADDIPLIQAQKYYVGDESLTVEYLFDGAPPSTPSLTEYKGWVDDGTKIVAVGSVCGRWRGNIYVRKTRYVVAI